MEAKQIIVVILTLLTIIGSSSACYLVAYYILVRCKDDMVDVDKKSTAVLAVGAFYLSVIAMIVIAYLSPDGDNWSIADGIILILPVTIFCILWRRIPFKIAKVLKKSALVMSLIITPYICTTLSFLIWVVLRDYSYKFVSLNDGAIQIMLGSVFIVLLLSAMTYYVASTFILTKFQDSFVSINIKQTALLVLCYFYPFTMLVKMISKRFFDIGELLPIEVHQLLAIIAIPLLWKFLKFKDNQFEVTLVILVSLIAMPMMLNVVLVGGWLGLIGLVF